MRKSNLFFLYTLVLFLLLGLVFLRDCFDNQAQAQGLQARAEMVRRHGLTDLCLFTEARYTRHPSQADFHAPFQDSPLSLEHFPSGSLLIRPYPVGKGR